MAAKRPLALLAVMATSVALATPAFANGSAQVGVAYTTTDGTRQFSVTHVDGSDFTSFTFGNDLAQPFRTTVKDQNRLLNSNGYQVNASLTNLYLQNGATHDYNTYIPSSALSLTYGASPLLGVSTLPVSPKVLLTGAAGALGTCADSAVASLLGLAAPLTSPLDALGLGALTSQLQNVCKQLAAVAATPISTVVTAASRVLDTPLTLPNLPFALTGAQQGGAFTNPSYAGPVASLDPARTGAPAATTKRVMTGTSLLGGGLDLTGLLSTLTTALHSQLDSLPAVGGTAKLTLAQAEAALSSVQPALASALSTLPTATVTSLLNRLTATVQSLTGLDLSTVTGTYDAFPVLTAAPAAAKAGTYDGTMVVDFIETGA